MARATRPNRRTPQKTKMITATYIYQFHSFYYQLYIFLLIIYTSTWPRRTTSPHSSRTTTSNPHRYNISTNHQHPFSLSCTDIDYQRDPRFAYSIESQSNPALAYKNAMNSLYQEQLNKGLKDKEEIMVQTKEQVEAYRKDY